MSIEATAWALTVDGLPDATARVILLGIASHARADGTGAWPSVATLAAYAVCSERTVHRRLRDLEALGVLERGDQQAVAHLPANRRPVVWNLPLGVTDWHPSRGDRLAGVSPGAARGVTGDALGVTAVADKPSNEPSSEPSPSTVGDAAGGEPVRADVDEVCRLVADHVETITGDRPRIGKRWEQQARLLLDHDGRTVDDVRAMVWWVTSSAFWGPNILSVPKLREKWPTLVARARGEAAGSSGSWAASELERARRFGGGAA